MGSSYGGITRTDTNPGPGFSFVYSTIAGREDMPVNYVSFYDALRFANWMNNGQGTGSTETGAYTLLGGTPEPSNGMTVTRNVGATIVLTGEDEWYKAAYYSALTTSYYDYPAGSNTFSTCASPTDTPNTANCNNAVGNLTIKGSYTGSASPYGTYDQGGNVWEWIDKLRFGPSRRMDGGSFPDLVSTLSGAAPTGFGGALNGWNNVGFRLALVPEPGTGLLVLAGLFGLAGWRRARN